jgi:putative redox protein
MSLKTQPLSFPGASGATLHASLDLPPEPPRAYAIFAHCFTCSSDFLTSARISRALAQRGIAVLRFDFTGLGQSQGEFAHTDFVTNVEDILSAVDFLRERYQAPALLIGHSLGGSAVLAAAPQVPEVVAVATINAPCSPEHVQNLLDRNQEEVISQDVARVTLAGRSFHVKRDFLRDIGSQQRRDALRSMRKALLIFHSPMDNVVNIEEASCIWQAARHPKSFISLDGADHLLTRREDAVYVADTTAAWVERYLARAERRAMRPLALEHGVVEVGEDGQGRYSQDVQAGKHRLKADEPRGVGGDDSGPAPYDLLLGALGACTTMTLRMYAERKGLDVQHLSVRLNHFKKPAAEVPEAHSPSGAVDVIEREIEIVGDLPEEVRARMLQIADRCPVHRTLHNEVVVRTRPKGDLT